MRGRLVDVIAGAAWLTVWIGGWLAGGLLFPNYESPAEIGAVLGFIGGLALARFIWLRASGQSGAQL